MKGGAVTEAMSPPDDARPPMKDVKALSCDLEAAGFEVMVTAGSRWVVWWDESSKNLWLRAYPNPALGVSESNRSI